MFSTQGIQPGLTSVLRSSNISLIVTGTTSLPFCLAGGDLDGDLYLLLTDPVLIPKKCYDPASYAAPESKKLNRDCSIDDGISFFLECEWTPSAFRVQELGADVSRIAADMLNDRTGQVATRHLHIAVIFDPACDCLMF